MGSTDIPSTATSPPLLVLYQPKQLFNRLSRTFVERRMRVGQPDRSRRQIAAGRPRIDTMDRRSECRGDRNWYDNCECFQSDMSTSSVAPVEIVDHGGHPPRSELSRQGEAGSAGVGSLASGMVSPLSPGRDVLCRG